MNMLFNFRSTDLRQDEASAAEATASWCIKKFPFIPSVAASSSYCDGDQEEKRIHPSAVMNLSSILSGVLVLDQEQETPLHCLSR